MIKNIYQKLGFKPLHKAIYSNAVIDEARTLFNELPLKNVMLHQLIIEPTLFEETFAISTAEDSELTKKTAEKINLTGEIQARLDKYRNDKTLTTRQKYDQLEFENIKDVENNTTSLSFQELSASLLCELHLNLTLGLDEYAHELGISRYHSGQLRASNSTKVGKIRQYIPPDHKEVTSLLKSLFKEFSSRKKVYLPDILEFHILLYAIHPFANGNKRVCRIIESLLLNHYGYSAQRSLSISVYYSEKKEACNFFIIESLRRREVDPFINFALRGYFYAGMQLFLHTQAQLLNDFYKNFKQFILKNVSEKRSDIYKKALMSILSCAGVFTHGKFIRRMERRGCTLGISQQILKDLTNKGILIHENQQYFIHRAAIEFMNYFEKLNLFFLKHNIGLKE